MPELEGVTHRWVEAFPGVEIHVAEAGPADGPPIMLVHGFPQSWWEWKAQIGPLADAGFRVLAPDMRGAGWSSAPRDRYLKADMAEDLAVVLAKLEVPPVTLVAHDWGGPVAGILMLRHPDKVRAFLGVNTLLPWFAFDGEALKDAWRFWYQFPMLTPVLGPRLLANPGRFLDVLAKWVGGGWMWDDADRQVYLDCLRDPARALAGSRWYRTFQSTEARAWMGGEWDAYRPDVPVRFLHGERDPVIREPLLRDYGERIADYAIEYVPDAGHWLPEQAPERVTRWLLHNAR